MSKRRLLYLTRARKLQKERDQLAKNQKKSDEQIKKDKLKKWLDSKDVEYNSQLGLKKLIILKQDVQEKLDAEKAKEIKLAEEAAKSTDKDTEKKDDPSEDNVSATASIQE